MKCPDDKLTCGIFSARMLGLRVKCKHICPCVKSFALGWRLKLPVE